MIGLLYNFNLKNGQDFMMNIYKERYDETNQWISISSPLSGVPEPSRPVRAMLLTPTGLLGIIRKSSMRGFNAKNVSLQIICLNQ